MTFDTNFILPTKEVQQNGTKSNESRGGEEMNCLEIIVVSSITSLIVSKIVIFRYFQVIEKYLDGVSNDLKQMLIQIVQTMKEGKLQ